MPSEFSAVPRGGIVRKSLGSDLITRSSAQQRAADAALRATFNAGVSACGKASKLEFVIELLEEMRERAVEPDAATYGSAIGTLARVAERHGMMYGNDDYDDDDVNSHETPRDDKWAHKGGTTLNLCHGDVVTETQTETTSETATATETAEAPLL